MKKWLKTDVLSLPVQECWASLEKYGAGRQQTLTIIRKSKWVKLKNKQWVQEHTLERVSAKFPRPPGTRVFMRNGGVVFAGDGWAYVIYSYPKRRLTLMKRNEK